LRGYQESTQKAEKPVTDDDSFSLAEMLVTVLFITVIKK